MKLIHFYSKNNLKMIAIVVKHLTRHALTRKNDTNTWYFSFRKLLSIHYVNSYIENDIYQSTVICKRRHCNLCVKLLLARCQYDDEDDNGDTCKISNNAIVIKDVAPSCQLWYHLDHSTELDKTLSYCFVIFDCNIIAFSSRDIKFR